MAMRNIHNPYINLQEDVINRCYKLTLKGIEILSEIKLVNLNHKYGFTAEENIANLMRLGQQFQEILDSKEGV